MQETQHESNEGAGAPASAEAQGRLENPNRIRLEYDIDVFTPYGHTAWLTDRTDVSVRSTQFTEGEVEHSLVWHQQTFKRLNWTQVGALRRLEGVPIAALLQVEGGSLLLLHHKSERPMWSMEPGLDEVTVAAIQRNTTQLSSEELFLLLHEQMLAGTVKG